MLLSLLGVMVYWGGCKKKTILSPIPHIEAVSFRTDSMKDSLYLVHAGFFEDTLRLVFTFTDGDADLGNDPAGNNYDVFLKDSRYADSTLPLFFPEIRDEIRSPDYGMSGTCIILLPAAYLFLPDSLHRITGDTLSFDVSIKDQAGNESNHYTTPRLLIRP